MKKHRNFLIFYSLWLAGILGLFVAFGEKDQNEILKIDSKVCTKTVKPEQPTCLYDRKACDSEAL